MAVMEKTSATKAYSKKTSTTNASTTKTRSSRRFVTLWHKRIGIVCALFVILLSITGVLLNHTSEFSLDKRFVSSPIVLDFYSVDTPTVHAFALDDAWVSESKSRLYFNDQPIDECEGRLVGVFQADGYWASICSQSIVLFTAENELVEKVGTSFGLPTPISRAGNCSSGLCIEVSRKLYRVDLESMDWQSADASELDIVWQHSASLPENLKQSVYRQSNANVITLEKLILDIHAGRYFGPLGPFFMDAVAILLILLSLSGIYLWLKQGKRRP